nr:glycoprotein 60 [Cryptosporidium tyzzeri]
MRLSLIIVLLSVIVSAVFSAPAVPLRGTLKDVSVEGSSSSSSTKTIAPANKARTVENSESSDSPDSGAGGSSGTEDNSGTSDSNATQDSTQGGTQGDNQEQSTASQATAPTQGSADTTQSTETNPNEECGTSFVMWFGEGTPAATLKCGGYTIVYAPIKDQTEPAPRYISGEVKSVTFESQDNTVKIKVDGKEFSTLSTSSSSPTENKVESSGVQSRSRRSLSEEGETAATVDLFAFTLDGGKRIEVAVPKSTETNKRTSYSLVADNKTFYTGSNSGSSNGIYKLNENGDLVDKDNKVLLKDAGSSAFGLRYIVPSVFAIFAALFVL